MHELWLRRHGTWKSRLADIIDYLSSGLPISPITIRPNSENKIIFIDGTHRFTAVKFSGEETVPTYFLPEDFGQLRELVKIKGT